MYSPMRKTPTSSSSRWLAFFVALVSPLAAAVSVQTTALETDSIIDPQNESPSNAYEVTLDAI